MTTNLADVRSKDGFLERRFKLREHGTDVRTEITAGLTTFFTMSYIIMVNPNILEQSDMPWGAVFLATIIAGIAGTLFIGLFANVPYALAPSMGLNAFFTYTVVSQLGFTWQEALAMVFICGLINLIITVTKLRTLLIKLIPESLQNAIGGGIGIFIAYVGFRNVGLIDFSSGVPAMPELNTPTLLITIAGLIITIILLIKNVTGAIFFGIVITTLIGIPFGVTQLGDTGAYASWATNILRKSGVHATGPYVIPNVKIDSYAVYTNNPYAGAIRGFGATQVPIAYEQQMDILAEKLSMDPVTIRLKNMFKQGSVTATGQVLTESIPLQECLEKVVEKIIVEDPESTAPYGAKGIGEPTMIPIGPAILNAIYDATGVRITELPVTPERLIKAIQEHEKEKRGA